MSMSYVPVEITAGTPLSAELMNYIETQYSKASELIAVHNHDEQYYTISISDTRFFKGGTVKPDADKIDGMHWNEIIGSLLPIKSVLGWNGTDADVPDGWHICDGGTYNGVATPDLRGKFPLGAGGLYTPQTSGGNSTLSTAGGTVTVGDHTLTVSEIPYHYHNWTDQYCTGSYSDQWYATVGVVSNTTSSRGATTAYNHDAADEAHNHGTKSITLNSFSIMPLYVAKYYIIKVS